VWGEGFVLRSVLWRCAELRVPSASRFDRRSQEFLLIWSVWCVLEGSCMGNVEEEPGATEVWCVVRWLSCWVGDFLKEWGGVGW